MLKPTIATLAAAAALSLGACGSDDGERPPTPGNGADRAFVAAMIPHHESAIAMAEIAAKRHESTFVENLAFAIGDAQANEVEQMRLQDAELAEEGVERGELGVPGHMMGMDDDPAALKRADPFDEAFLKMMIPHHEGAIAMGRAELAKGEDPELKELAQVIVEAQEREIAEMRQHLGDAGAEHGAGHSG